MLTGRQIERYSRQIITQGFGGLAQERLLASHILVAGRQQDLEPILPYLAGAGVGHITLELDCGSEAIAALQTRLAGLNPDAKLSAGGHGRDGYDLIFATMSSGEATEQFGAEEHSKTALIYVRLDADPLIAIIPSRPPCLKCADADLNASLSEPCANPGLVVMMAAIEAIKLLAGITPANARLIEFDGYAATSRPLSRRTGASPCGCPIIEA